MPRYKKGTAGYYLTQERLGKERRVRNRRRQFLATWKPKISTRCVSKDPYVYTAAVEFTFYGEAKRSTDYASEREEAREKAILAAMDSISYPLNP